jgi:ferredoxin
MPTITFSKTGQTLEAATGSSFLELCQDNDTPQDFGCTVGSCGTCVCVVSAGAENVNAASPDELDTLELCTDVEGARLGCQLTINGDVTISPTE